jgi:PAS domain S-box-containing protein
MFPLRMWTIAVPEASFSDSFYPGMPAAPLPPDEAQRLEALKTLRLLGLNASREERFDRITRLFQAILNVPIALIAFVDKDNQWYKSCVGLDPGVTRRDDSFCAYTILSDDPLIVEDASLDPRFRDNPLVIHGPAIRFYAGVPLHASNGQRVGALCAISLQPRTLSARESEMMRSLAGVVESELNSLSLMQAMGRVMEHESQFRDLVENCSDIIHIVDVDGRILYANPAWREALGYTASDLQQGLSLFQIVHPDLVPVSRERLRAQFAGDTTQHFETCFITRDRRLLNLEGNVCCQVADGRPRSACGIFHDITARKAMDEKSERARREAEQASLAKSQFLANISHEIRTPLNGIIGMSSMLMLTGLTEEQSRYARTIDSSGRVLLTLVNQILDFSKFDDEAASLEKICFLLPALIQEVAALMSGRAQEKGLALRWFVAEDVPQCLLGDPERLRQILTNLLGNAVKFTEIGQIRLDVRVEVAPASPEQGVVLRFTVIDTGIGLQRDACARIFDAFAQADPSTTRKYGGTGLGLAISRQIVRLMGGDIHVHSKPGEGATFWFTARFGTECGGGTLPLSAMLAEGEPVVRVARSLRILVAEDNPINQLVLSEQLTKLGHTCMTVQNGVEALEALENSSWDAVLMDCQMPVMDGYETVEAIRRAEEADGEPHTWVVAVTANALDGEREACLRSGMDDFVSKPFQVQDLAQVIARIPLREGESGFTRPAIDSELLGSMAESKATNGENLLERMVNLFTESGPPLLDQMDRALREDDFPAAIRSAHKLAGGCGYFGASELYRLCTEAERLGRSGQHDRIRSLAPLIRQEYARVEVALMHNRAGSKSAD